MPIIRFEELKEMDAPTLAGKLRDLRFELYSDYGVISAGGRPSNPGRISEIRKTIARIHTVARQKNIDIAAEELKLVPTPPAAAEKKGGAKPEKKAGEKKKQAPKKPAQPEAKTESKNEPKEKKSKK